MACSFKVQEKCFLSLCPHSYTAAAYALLIVLLISQCLPDHTTDVINCLAFGCIFLVSGLFLTKQ